MTVFLGCASGKKVSESIRIDNLEAKIIVVWSLDRARRGAVISADTLFLGSQASEQMVSGFAPEFASKEIFLAAAPTHLSNARRNEASSRKSKR